MSNIVVKTITFPKIIVHERMYMYTKTFDLHLLFPLLLHRTFEIHVYKIVYWNKCHYFMLFFTQSWLR